MNEIGVDHESELRSRSDLGLEGHDFLGLGIDDHGVLRCGLLRVGDFSANALEANVAIRGFCD